MLATEWPVCASRGVDEARVALSGSLRPHVKLLFADYVDADDAGADERVVEAEAWRERHRATSLVYPRDVCDAVARALRRFNAQLPPHMRALDAMRLGGLRLLV